LLLGRNVDWLLPLVVLLGVDRCDDCFLPPSLFAFALLSGVAGVRYISTTTAYLIDGREEHSQPISIVPNKEMIGAIIACFWSCLVIGMNIYIDRRKEEEIGPTYE